ncbi:RodZ domain-containing protein [Thiolinea disciformis]|uniref:RodZ domain-containing protein n=1 Tax=Thiolinea disciformis TaxID=125614 RepID=UPI0014615938|nr:RodZ domain-containing protein [Thiolinea disciformis]
MTETQPIQDTEHQATPQAPARDPSVILPGDLSHKLKAIRDKADMNVEQAASEMRLSSAIVNALEAENFKDLPDPPYVRGYLRSYARLDGSDPQDLIRTYEVLRVGAAEAGKPIKSAIRNTPTITNTSSLASKDPKQRDKRVYLGSGNGLRLFGLVLVVALFAMLSMVPSVADWVKNTWASFSEKATLKHPTASMAKTDLPAPLPSSSTTSNSSSADTASNTSTADSTVSTNASDTNTSPATTDATTTAATPSTTPPTDSTTASGNTATATTPEATSLAMKDTGKPSVEAGALSTDIKPADVNTPATSDTKPTEPIAISTPPSDATASTTTAPSTTTTTATATPPATTTPPASAATDTASTKTPAPATRQQPIDGPVVVRMEFLNDAWLQVRDGRNKIIFEALNTANTWKEFKTGTPLSFKIGNAEGVRIYFNGQAYNLAPHIKGSVARFTIN